MHLSQTRLLVSDFAVSFRFYQPTWQIRVAHFRDPDGNLVELSGPLREQGS